MHFWSMIFHSASGSARAVPVSASSDAATKSRRIMQLLFGDDARRRATGAFTRYFCPDFRGNFAKQLGMRRAGVGDRNRPAFIRGFADRQVERHLSQEVGAEPLGFAPG